MFATVAVPDDDDFFFDANDSASALAAALRAPAINTLVSVLAAAGGMGSKTGKNRLTSNDDPSEDLARGAEGSGRAAGLPLASSPPPCRLLSSSSCGRRSFTDDDDAPL
jgi:hypothetical protein